VIDNTALLGSLMKRGVIRLHDSALMHAAPAPLPPNFDFDKVEGMLLGVAIGDSLGASTEGQTPSQRRQEHGEVRDFSAFWGHVRHPAGSPTDDTQLTFRSLKQLLHDNGLVPDNLAQHFCKYHITGIGTTVQAFITNYKDRHKPWYDSGIDSLGNGAMMRISPVVIPYLRQPHQSMYADAALDAMLTHNSFANVSACVAFSDILWSLLSASEAPEPSWWIKAYCSVAEKLEGDAIYVPRARRHRSYRGPLWRFTQQVVTEALGQQLPTVEACESWGSGANMLETVPTVTYILARHAQDPEEAIIRAANDTCDNDTVAAIVGAAVGALHGAKALPKRWVRHLTGRTDQSDDGEVFRLIGAARRQFWSGG
jgi:ADP-ribosyl-[dinitrogen reductase] hydrolase